MKVPLAASVRVLERWNRDGFWVEGGRWLRGIGLTLTLMLLTGLGLGLGLGMPWGMGVEAGETLGHAVNVGERLEGTVDEGKGEVVVRFRGRVVVAYAFASNQFKPYLRELYTLRGENVLQDAPADHLHHHGLMLALRVNGVNFWEERPPAGRQVSEAPPELVFATKGGGLPEAVIRHPIRWVTGAEGGGAEVLLREVRELRVMVNVGMEEVAVEWRSTFETGEGAERYVLHGPDYHGLGMRLPREFDHVARFANASNLSYTEAQTYDVRPAAWTSVSGLMGGREVQVVMAAPSSNPGRHSFFSMRNAFAYLAATPEPAREPLVFRRGDRFRYRYLVMVYPAHQNAGYLSERLEPWLARGQR